MSTSLRADLLIRADQILTLDSQNTTPEALAISAGRILATGSYADLRSSFSAPKTLDLTGTTIIPGLIDPHCHLHRYAQEFFEIDLRGCASPEEMVQRVRDFAEQHPQGWLIGRGWDQNNWSDKRYPDRRLIDRYFPDRPVYLERIDIHASLVNQYLLDKVGFNAQSQVEGGEIVLENGEPTGLLIDHARDPVLEIMPPLTEAEWETALLMAQQKLWSYGLVGLGDALLSREEAERLLRLQEEGKFQLWVYGMLPGDEAHLTHYLPLGPQRNGRIHLGAFKFFADGALGSHGAWLRDSYSDDPGNRGLNLLGKAQISEWAQQIYESGFQMVTHAIGDAANLGTLALYAAILQGPNDRRWRIEHCQMITPEALPQFGHYSIFPSVQPTHLISDASWVEQRLGERMAYAYPAKSLRQSYGHLALGTDFPVESPDPWATYRAAVDREAEGQIWHPEERLRPLEALRGMTLDSARAEFAEGERGSLEKGKWADFVVLNLNPIHKNHAKMADFSILQTWMAGKMVFSQ